jgi:asparagine synthase (glutamine-hydrolysing)
LAGFVVIYGDPERRELESMFASISHRGPAYKDVFTSLPLMMAQNHLEADLAATPEKPGIFANLQADGLTICYDGQMGNWQELGPKYGVADGPFREPALLLKLYQRFGRDMFLHLPDGIFAFVIADGERLLAARDLLGIKTLFYGHKNGNLYLGSELKSLTPVTDEVYAFPAGHCMDEKGHLTRFAALPQTPPSPFHADLDEMIRQVKRIIQKSFDNRVDFRVPTASLLSGGIDSSVIAALASEAVKQKFGENARLKTFSLGVGVSQDILNARLVAQHLDTDYHEYLVSLEDLLAVLPEVVYYLESFDPSLVRSAASNFLISRYARREGAQVLLSGEGGDEVFCGYIYLKDFPPEEIFSRQMECIGFLQKNASLRLDRMNQCHGIRVVAPLISGELLDYSLAIPPEYKQKPERGEKIEKWIFRKAFEDRLPDAVVWRLKQEFSQGSGSADVLPQYFETVFTDEELAETQARFPMVRSKEELYYFKIFTEHFGSGKAVDTVGQWICI